MADRIWADWAVREFVRVERLRERRRAYAHVWSLSRKAFAFWFTVGVLGGLALAAMLPQLACP